MTRKMENKAKEVVQLKSHQKIGHFLFIMGIYIWLLNVLGALVIQLIWDKNILLILFAQIVAMSTFLGGVISYVDYKERVQNLPIFGWLSVSGMLILTITIEYSMRIFGYDFDSLFSSEVVKQHVLFSSPFIGSLLALLNFKTASDVELSYLKDRERDTRTMKKKNSRRK